MAFENAFGWVRVFSASALYVALAACGGLEPQLHTETTARAFDPSCGHSCPDTCWAEIRDLSGGGKELRVWIFDADRYEPASAVENAIVKLSSSYDNWDPSLDGQVPDPVPATLEVHWNLPVWFELPAPNLTTTFIPEDLEEVPCEM